MRCLVKSIIFSVMISFPGVAFLETVMLSPPILIFCLSIAYTAATGSLRSIGSNMARNHSEF